LISYLFLPLNFFKTRVTLSKSIHIPLLIIVSDKEGFWCANVVFCSGNYVTWAGIWGWKGSSLWGRGEAS
jgi:hypothetical protein